MVQVLEGGEISLSVVDAEPDDHHGQAMGGQLGTALGHHVAVAGHHRAPVMAGCEHPRC